MKTGLITSLKKSPTHLAVMRVTITGKANLILPVASIIMTVKLIVILTIPPRLAAAPTSAYLPGSTQV